LTGKNKVGIYSAEFYRLLLNLDPLPTTSGVNPKDLLEAYQKEVCAAIMHALVPEETITPASTSSPR
jgi:hypothetical protein